MRPSIPTLFSSTKSSLTTRSLPINLDILPPICASFSRSSYAASLFAADITGAWNASVETDAGSGNPTFVLKQSGDALTGHYSGALGEADIKGTVKDDHVEFRVKALAGGDDVEVVYSGTLEGDNKRKGTVKLGSLASGTFTADRK